MRAVAGIVRRTWCCRGRRAAASGFKREVTINMVLGGAWVALSGCEGGGRCGSAGLALPGQECIGLRLKREVTINMLLGGSCVMRAAVAMSLFRGGVFYSSPWLR